MNDESKERYGRKPGDTASRTMLSLEQKIAFLRAPESYPEHPERVDAIETHFAWVFLTGQHAYKLKKPMRQGHMDYRLLAARERGCREEVRLNRRLAPSVYLGVVALSAQGESLVIGEGERVEEWLVRMRRLPSSRMLDRVLERGSVRVSELNRLTALLVRFFERAERNPLNGERYIARLRTEVIQNRSVLRRLGTQIEKPLVEELTDVQLDLITREHSALAARAAHVVEGHGDLRAEHVCLGPPVCVIDSLEFDRKLRLLDPLEDLALLALEIERLGHRSLADELVRRFCVASGDLASDGIFHFYVSHRAVTRAKLAAWHVGEPQYPDPRPWVARARSYLQDALRHVKRASGGQGTAFDRTDGSADSPPGQSAPGLNQRTRLRLQTMKG